jgi:hypothetical protein
MAPGRGTCGSSDLQHRRRQHSIPSDRRRRRGIDLRRADVGVAHNLAHGLDVLAGAVSLGAEAVPSAVERFGDADAVQEGVRHL